MKGVAVNDAGIDDESIAGHEAGIRGGEVSDRRCNVLGLRKIAHRREASLMLDHLLRRHTPRSSEPLRRLLPERCHDIAWMHGVAADLELALGAVLRDRFGQAPDRR